MSVYHRVNEKRRIMEEFEAREKELASVLSRQITPKGHLENEKRLRREIANSNERRRMQSINAGFQVLRTLIPHGEGEKLSKAAILQLTTEYINNLQQEKSKVIAQNAYFKRVLSEHSRRCNLELSLDISYGSPPTKRKKRDTESSDEGITADYEDTSGEEIRRELTDLRRQLEMERQLRMILECKAHAMQPTPKLDKAHHAHSPAEKQPLNPHQEIHLYAKSVKHEEVPKYELVEPKYEPEQHIQSEPEQPRHELPMLHKYSRTTESSESMSRRNLETIVEAIRHLEGDQIHMDHHKHHEIRRPIVHSEESEKDSSITSDQEDLRSESSGRDSPSPSSVHYVNLQNVKTFPVSQSPSHNYIEKYPVVANVLHGNISQPQYFYRPGVIVQKS